ncbi:unnamed protein product [Cunninghamella echinulata]
MFKKTELSVNIPNNIFKPLHNYLLLKNNEYDHVIIEVVRKYEDSTIVIDE